MIEMFLVSWCAVWARIAGGGIWRNRPPLLSEVLMTMPLGIAIYLNYYDIPTAFMAFAWSYAWFQTGHGTAYTMNSGRSTDALDGRKLFLSPIIDTLCEWLGKPLGGDFYCWTFMGLKGALMALPLGWFALPASVLWPASYFFGNRLCYRRGVSAMNCEVVSELTAGACYGALVVAYFLALG